MENKFKKFVSNAYIIALLGGLLLAGMIVTIPTIFLGKKTLSILEIILTITVLLISLFVIFGGLVQLIRDIKSKNTSILKKRFILALVIFIARLIIVDNIENIFPVVIDAIDSILMAFAYGYYFSTDKSEVTTD